VRILLNSKAGIVMPQRLFSVEGATEESFLKSGALEGGVGAAKS